MAIPSLNTSNHTGSSAHAVNGLDAQIETFLQPDFDPAAYLNNALPPLSTSSTTRATQSGAQHTRAVPLPELSNQLQSLLNQLNAQTSRLSNSLTQLTDEIIRSGGRLAYEVEVLRGETISLTSALENDLKDDIQTFTSGSTTSAPIEANGSALGVAEATTASVATADQPDYLDRLKILASVRARLDAVVKVFGEAMQWPLAPSELSVTSSIISVASPAGGEDGRSREGKGQAYAAKLRADLNELIGSGADATDLEAAAAMVENLRQLAEVWKGTAEEKARLKFVESLQKLVEDKQKALAQPAGARQTTLPARGMDYPYGDLSSSRLGTDSGLGFLQNLRT